MDKKAWQLAWINKETGEVKYIYPKKKVKKDMRKKENKTKMRKKSCQFQMEL